MKWMFLFVTFCVISFGCQRIILYSAGVRTPKEENKISLNSYIKLNNLDTNNIYIAKDTASFFKLNKISSSQSGYAFFNSNKKMIIYKDTGSACSAPIILFAKSLCTQTQQLYYKEFNTSFITNRIRPLNLPIIDEKDYDYYAFIFWYKYLGKRKFKSDVIDIVESLNKNHCSIKIHLVNLDLQPGWKKDIPIKIN
jgi:hypothetical protein